MRGRLAQSCRGHKERCRTHVGEGASHRCMAAARRIDSPATTVPAKPRKFGFGRHTHCVDGHAEVRVGPAAGDFDILQVLKQALAAIPR